VRLFQNLHDSRHLSFDWNLLKMARYYSTSCQLWKETRPMFHPRGHERCTCEFQIRYGSSQYQTFWVSLLSLLDGEELYPYWRDDQ